MKKIFVSGCFVITATLALAHPGTGIVKDSKGAIYYTDLEQVWKIDPVTSRQTVVVRSVHTHELFMDAGDNLYGEHLWYNGEAADTWEHYVWRLDSRGVLDTVISPSAGFLDNYSFARDSAGNMYQAQRFKPVSRIQKISPDGKVVTLAEGAFGNIGWLHATPRGLVYFADEAGIYKIENGRLQQITTALHRADVYSIWSDEKENLYLALTDTRAVKKITPDGLIKDVVETEASWMPCGGLFDNNGNLWLLETSTANKVRVRKIDAATPAGIAVPAGHPGKKIILPVCAGVLLIAVTGLFLKRMQQKND